MMIEEEEFLEDQKLSEEEQKLLDEVYSRLDIFEEKCQPYHEEARKCREIMHMRDPDQEINPKAGKKTLQLQTLKSTINNVIADQMENMPEAKILPETPDKQEAAEDLQDAVHYIIYVINGYEKLHYRRAEDFYVAGTAVTQVAWDPDMAYGKGDIALVRYPIEAFLWDPTAEDIQDSRAVMKVAWHPLSWYKAHYPETGKYVRSDENCHNNVGMTTAQEDATHASDEERALMIEYWYREYDASSHRYTINVALCAGNALLDSQKNVYAHGMYPFVIDTHDSIEGSIAGEGMVNELAPMMRYINRYASYADMNLRMSSKGRVIIRRGAGISPEEFADMDNDIIQGDRVAQGEDWNWIQNQPFNNMITQQMIQFQTELKQDSGANQFTRGETTNGIVSGKAINSLMEAGGKIAKMRTQQLKAGFKAIVEQILWLMAEFYDKDRVTMITGRDGNMRELAISAKRFFGKVGKGEIPPPPYSVEIEIQNRNPARIDAQNQVFMDAYTMAAQAQQYFPLSALFQLLNIDGKDRLMPIIRQNEQYQQNMQQMAQQLEQQAQQMDVMKQENDNLKAATSKMTDTLSNIRANGGGGYAPPEGTPMKVAEAGGGPNTLAARVNEARNTLAGTTM